MPNAAGVQSLWSSHRRMSERLSPNPVRLMCRSTARIVFNQMLGSIGNSVPFLGCHLVLKLRCLFRASTDDRNSVGTVALKDLGSGAFDSRYGLVHYPRTARSG